MTGILAGSIGSIAKGFFSELFTGITNWLAARRAENDAKELGTATEAARNATAGEAEISTARRASDAVRADLDRAPDRVRAPDADAATRGPDGIS